MKSIEGNSFFEQRYDSLKVLIIVPHEDDEINNNLKQMTSDVSEIKTKILKISIENKNIFIPEDNTKKNDNMELIDSSLYQIRIKSLKSENQNLKCLIEDSKDQIAFDPETKKIRSKTYHGIAQAMAEQWG